MQFIHIQNNNEEDNDNLNIIEQDNLTAPDNNDHNDFNNAFNKILDGNKVQQPNNQRNNNNNQ